MSNSEYTWYLVKPNPTMSFDKHHYLVQIYNKNKEVGNVLHFSELDNAYRIRDLSHEHYKGWYTYICENNDLATKISDEEATLYLLKGNLDDLRDD